MFRILLVLFSELKSVKCTSQLSLCPKYSAYRTGSTSRDDRSDQEGIYDSEFKVSRQLE